MKKFIVVRFAPGSAGKFCSILLQLSPDVNAWDAHLDKVKHDPDLALEYFKTKFTRNFQDWQKNEPEIPYQTQFVSNRWPRGNDITHSQALDNLKNDQWFNLHYNNNKKIVLISNKSCIPKWVQDRSDMINLHIDSRTVKKWVYKARYRKLFLEINPTTFILKQEHPDYCSPHRAQLAQQFQNPNIYYGTKCSFLKKFVINDSLTKLFTNYDNIIQDHTNKTVDQHCMPLSELLNQDNCYLQLQSLCRKLEITCPSQSLILNILKYYLLLHQNH
jgi:hypothetical protein